MISLNKRLAELGDKLTDERAIIEAEIKKIDNQIDEMVYTIYEISKDEREIIEKSIK